MKTATAADIPDRRSDWLCYHCIPKNKRKITNGRGVNGYCDLCGEEDKLWAVNTDQAKGGGQNGEE